MKIYYLLFDSREMDAYVESKNQPYLYPGNTDKHRYIHTDINLKRFIPCNAIEAKGPKCPVTREWIKKLQPTDTME